MSCSKMENKILGYVDGRLKEGEQLEMEKHLAACPTCTLRVNEFRAVNSLLEELPVIEPSAAFDVRVRARVAAEPVKQSWWAWIAPSPRVAFAAAMLTLAIVWIGVNQPQQLPPGLSGPQADMQLMSDLPVLEDHDVLSNFEPLKDLPQQVQAEEGSDTNQQM
jgi:anti-sigma factor RsiW